VGNGGTEKEEEIFKREGQTASVEALLNGIFLLFLSTYRILFGRFVTDVKPSRRFNDETRASHVQSPRKRNQTCSYTPPLYKLPSVWIVLTDTIMVSMWWIGVFLSFFRLRWHHVNEIYGPKLLFKRRRRARKPPDPRKKVA
jgi:hypothetical protein